MTEFKTGLCRIETKSMGIAYGQITEVFGDSVLFSEFFPAPLLATEIQKDDLIQYESVDEEDIPPYE